MLKTIARWLLKKELRSLYSVITEQEREVSRNKVTITELEAQRVLKEHTQPPQVRVTNRIHMAEFQRFKGSLPQAVITGSSTDLQAASLVGQQFVLDKMERELVSG